MQSADDNSGGRTSLVRPGHVDAPESGSAAGAVLGQTAVDARLAQPDRPRPAPFNYWKRQYICCIKSCLIPSAVRRQSC